MPREIRLNAFDMNCVGHIEDAPHNRMRTSDEPSWIVQ